MLTVNSDELIFSIILGHTCQVFVSVIEDTDSWLALTLLLLREWFAFNNSLTLYIFNLPLFRYLLILVVF
jgi:hypothetical protein